MTESETVAFSLLAAAWLPVSGHPLVSGHRHVFPRFSPFEVPLHYRSMQCVSVCVVDLLTSQEVERGGPSTSLALGHMGCGKKTGRERHPYSTFCGSLPTFKCSRLNERGEQRRKAEIRNSTEITSWTACQLFQV